MWCPQRVNTWLLVFFVYAWEWLLYGDNIATMNAQIDSELKENFMWLQVNELSQYIIK